MNGHPLVAVSRRYRGLWLLLALVFCLFMTPLADMGHVSIFTTPILFAIIILTAINAATQRRIHMILAVALAILWLLGIWFGFVLGRMAELVGSDLVFICLMILTIYIILGPMLAAKETDVDMLFGAIAAYLLIALAWAVSYDVIEHNFPGSFDDGTEGRMGWSASLYFSLTTLTTLGYGDVTPVNALAGTWATLEAVVGQLYIAVLIARIVALIRA